MSVTMILIDLSNIISISLNICMVYQKNICRRSGKKEIIVDEKKSNISCNIIDKI